MERPSLIVTSEALPKWLFGPHIATPLCLGALALLHIGAALMRRFVKRDSAFERMLPEAKDPKS